MRPYSTRRMVGSPSLRGIRRRTEMIQKRSWLLILFLLIAGPAPAQDVQGGPEKRTPEKPQSADAVQETVMTPYLGVEFPPGKNLVWCATFQMVWDSLKKEVGGPVHTRPGCVTVEKLNGERLSKSDIPMTGAFTAAGLVGDGILDQIRKGVKAIPGSSPGLVPQERDFAGQGFVMYAYLLRSLAFHEPFESLGAWSWAGGDKNVACFGISLYSPSSEKQRNRASEVCVIWHRFVMERAKSGEDDLATIPKNEEFIIELVSTSPEDRLILASIAPAKTLQGTVEQVLAHLKHPNSKTSKDGLTPEIRTYLSVREKDAATERAGGELTELQAREVEARERRALSAVIKSVSDYKCLLLNESLYVPYTQLEMTKQYDDLIGQVVVGGSKKVNGLPIVDARQRISFGLNERGAVLESEASIEVGGVAETFRSFAFTKPFLVLLMRKGAERPYFVLWVANPEVLVANPPKNSARGKKELDEPAK